MLSATNSSLEPLSPQKTLFEFLGTMAGNQTFLDGNNNGQTYARIYTTFGGSDDLRKTISNVGNNQCWDGYKSIGDKYSCGQTTPYSSNPISMQGGGFFSVVKTFDDQKMFLNCFAYALETFGNKLEKSAKRNMVEIQHSVSQKMDHTVDQYFTNVVEPEEGDLAV